MKSYFNKYELLIIAKPLLHIFYYNSVFSMILLLLYNNIKKKQRRKRPLDTPRRMIERREREGEIEREKKVEGEI